MHLQEGKRDDDQLTIPFRNWGIFAFIESLTLGPGAGRSRSVTRTSFWIGSCIGFGRGLCESESITLDSQPDTVLAISCGFGGGVGSSLELRAWFAGPVTFPVPARILVLRICNCSAFDRGNREKCCEDKVRDLHGSHYRLETDILM